MIDDGSSDNTSNIVNKKFPDVILIKGDGNLWWSGATNLGIRFAMESGAITFGDNGPQAQYWTPVGVDEYSAVSGLSEAVYIESPLIGVDGNPIVAPGYLIIIIFVMIGVLLGYIISLRNLISYRSEMSSLIKKNKEISDELDGLRNVAVGEEFNFNDKE